MLNTNFSFFLDNQKDLYSRYPKKFILIRDGKIEIVTDSYRDAFVYAVRNHFEQGSYIIQESAKDMDDVAENFYSINVSFV